MSDKRVKIVRHGDIPPEVEEFVQKVIESMPDDGEEREIHMGNTAEIEKIKAEFAKNGELVEENVIPGVSIWGKRTSQGVKNALIKAIIEKIMSSSFGKSSSQTDPDAPKSPGYNGVPGDACDCDTCNERRRENGPEIGIDDQKRPDAGERPEPVERLIQSLEELKEWVRPSEEEFDAMSTEEKRKVILTQYTHVKDALRVRAEGVQSAYKVATRQIDAIMEHYLEKEGSAVTAIEKLMPDMRMAKLNKAIDFMMGNA